MFSFLIIILVKNHDLFLALDNHCQITEHSINQSNQLSLSTLTISQHQLSLSSQACQLSDSISLSSHAQFSWFNFLWLKFSCSFLIIFLFDWFHFHVWDFDQIYYCKQLFCFVLCSSWEVFHLSLFFHHVLSSCLRFQSSSSLWIIIQSHAAFSGKIFCLHLQIFNSEVQIFLAFVYNTWKWILQISLVKTQ